MHHLLPILLLIPALGAVVGAFLPVAFSRNWALLVSLATFVVALVIGFAGNLAQFDFQGAELFSIGASFSLGIDAISLWLLLLTALLVPLSIAFSFGSIKDREREYYCWLLVLLVAMLGVFAARDLLVFYIFFELTLVPMFFIIGIWGGPERRFAAGKFFLFTFTGSVFTLAGAIYLGSRAHTFDIPAIVAFAQNNLTATQRHWMLLAFLAGFAVKVPLFPVHTWLPLAHTEAPTAGSVILAGVLLKLGTYGLLRLAVPIGILVHSSTGIASAEAIRVVGTICVIGVIYGALVAWVQQDIKKLVAYSSISHLGFCVLGLFALNTWGIEGSVLYMINHGLSTGALFLVVGMIYDRYHTRDINQLSGLARRMPILSFFFILFTFSSVGLPGLNGFVSEFLTILGAFTSPQLGVYFGGAAALGIILGAIYMLHMAARVIWGPLKTPEVHDDHGGHGHHGPGDIGAREIALLIPLAIAVVVLGVYPSGILRSMDKPVGDLIRPITINQTEPPTVAQAVTPPAPQLVSMRP